MKNDSTWILLCLACVMTLSYPDKKNTADGSGRGVPIVLPDTKNEIAVQILERRDFHHELVSNGKIDARGKADLCFKTGEAIAHICMKNGDCVQKGQKLVNLDKFCPGQKLSQSEDALLEAELELKDVLVGQGYSPDGFSKAPAETMKVAKVKSGYEQSKSRCELAKRDMKHATLIAPFDGVVANLFSKSYNPANTSEAFCTIIDSRGMEVGFTALENELAFTRMGDRVVITPHTGGDALENSVSEINPLADANGMVKMKASINAGGKLLSGMNVRVSVHRSLRKQLVIPKGAVALCSGKQVAFTLRDGKAIWDYVNTGLEGTTECTVSDKSWKGIEDGLLEGDTVTVTEDLNLTHEAEVYVK